MLGTTSAPRSPSICVADGPMKTVGPRLPAWTLAGAGVGGTVAMLTIKFYRQILSRPWLAAQFGGAALGVQVLVWTGPAHDGLGPGEPCE